MALASSSSHGREEVRITCRHHPSRTEMIITFSLLMMKKIMMAIVTEKKTNGRRRDSKMEESIT